MKIIVLIIALLSIGMRGVNDVHRQTYRWPVMGTVAQITLRGNEAQIKSWEAELLPVVRETYLHINSLLSAWDDDSELSRLSANKCTNWVESASPVVKPCYSAALKLYRESKGAFSPYVGAKLRKLGISDGGSYSSFDLGAIAKGFAVDVAFEKIAPMARSGSLLIDLGGNLRVVGDGVWRTGVRNPFNKKAPFVGIIALTNGESVATSGNYERFVERDGVRYSHILDGRTGNPTSGIAAVTVVTPPEYGAMSADGLSTTLFVLGPHEGSKFLSVHYPRALALWIPDTPSHPKIFATNEMSLRLKNPIFPLTITETSH